MLYKNLAVGVIVLFCGLHIGTASAIGVVAIPDRNVMNVGESVTVEVRINDLGDFVPPSLSVYDIDLMFDPGLFTPNLITFGDQLDHLFLGSAQQVIFTPFGLNVFELSFEDAALLDATQPSSFRLFSVEFSAISSGSGLFDLVLWSLGDAQGQELSFLATTTSASIQVAQPSNVPVPAAVWLFGTAIVGFVGLSRRRKLT